MFAVLVQYDMHKPVDPSEAWPTFCVAVGDTMEWAENLPLYPGFQGRVFIAELTERSLSSGLR